MVSVWFVIIVGFSGLVGIAAATWGSIPLMRAFLLRKPFWIVAYSHRHGLDTFPCFCKESPTLGWLLENDAEFARDWEGDRPSDDGEWIEGRDDEWVDVSGPWFVGVNLWREGG